MKRIDISTPKHPATFVLVDDADFDCLNQWKWCRNTRGYAVRRDSVSGRVVLMHREILSPPAGVLVDHINGDPLDNQRENMRLCTHAENIRNCKKHRNGATSRFKGVSWNKRDKSFQVSIMFQRKAMNLGSYKSEEDAARAYEAAAHKYHGEFARTN